MSEQRHFWVIERHSPLAYWRPGISEEPSDVWETDSSRAHFFKTKFEAEQRMLKILTRGLQGLQAEAIGIREIIHEFVEPDAKTTGP